MCVALPGKVMTLENDTAVVDFHGNLVKARTGLADIAVGDYVLVHAGCVLQKISPQEAGDLQELMDEVNAWS